MEAIMIDRVKTLASVFLIAVSLAVATGCALAPDPLDGTAWRLAEWSVSSIDPAAVSITAKFADDQISGDSGVNSYNGSYATGSGNAFSISEVGATLMAGPEPAMRAESAYMTLLAGARSYKLADGTLTLYDQGGNESLIYEAVPVRR
jgi:heat shock protein HslJ